MKLKYRKANFKSGTYTPEERGFMTRSMTEFFMTRMYDRLNNIINMTHVTGDYIWGRMSRHHGLAKTYRWQP